VKQDMRDLKLDLFLKLGSHLGSCGDARREDILKQTRESPAQSSAASATSRD